MATQKKVGICWNCRGIEIRAYVTDHDQYLASVEKEPKDVIDEALWEDIRQDCILCSSMKSLMENYVFAIRDITSLDGHVLGLYCLASGAWTLYCEDNITRECLAGLILVPSQIARPVAPEIHDFAFMKEWLEECESGHEQSCGQQETLSTALHPFKVIHSATRRLCTLPSGKPYICLSYLWGKDTTTNIAQQVPKTIEDAMHVAIELGIPYLWVDRYCINQSDEKEKQMLIENMDLIYSCAAVTIVAAAGDGPHHGLSGINGTLRSSQKVLEVGNAISFIALKETYAEIAPSAWNTRGWVSLFNTLYCISQKRHSWTGLEITDQFQVCIPIFEPYPCEILCHRCPL